MYSTLKVSRLRWTLTLVAALTAGTTARGQGPVVTIVNMVPNFLSDESNHDSEPNLAVNPSNPMQIAGSAFTPDPQGGDTAPIYLSSDGGLTWDLRPILPSHDLNFGTGDITLRFGGSNTLYAGILRLPFPEPANPRLNILKTVDPTKPDLMTVLSDRNGVDQPFIQVDTLETKDRIFVGSNNTKAGGRSATIDLTPGAGTGENFRTAVIETRDGDHDGPQIRPLIHPDGKTIYAAFYGWRTVEDISDTRFSAKADVVVVRDDEGGSGTAPFTALTEPGDGRAGRIVARVTVPFVNENQPDFGQERVGGDLSLAADPRPGSASTVYLAYCDGTVGGDYTLHLLRSTDRGATWGGDLRTLPKAKNPAIAVNPDGKAALLYQQLTGSGTAQRWETILELSTDGFATTRRLVLATVPALSPPANGRRPYNGDYLYMMAVGRDFYGIFPANNTPDLSHFPAARPTYQRNVDFAAKVLLGADNTTKIDPSIDPFFFRVSDAP